MEFRSLPYPLKKLKGHPETRVNEFSFFIDRNSLIAEVHTTAKPGLFLTHLTHQEENLDSVKAPGIESAQKG